MTIILVISCIIYEYYLYRIAETETFGVSTNKYSPPSNELTLFNLAGFPRAVGIVAYTFEVHDASMAMFLS